ncbi:MAG: type II toxin-antitoxin system RelE/ParE family toxin [Saprospiraceae bacterium]|nr:type II toxin-antitoxin system RelE/ParE family toxin [Saprospiraceae bacterium]
MVQIKWLISAKLDLKEIYSFSSQDSSNYAQFQVIRIQRKISILKRNILSGRTIPEINKPDIRELIQGNYRIIYRVVNTNKVHILLIHHSARDLNKRLK